MHVHVYACICLYVYACMYACMYPCVHACMKACMHACKHEYALVRGGADTCRLCVCMHPFINVGRVDTCCICAFMHADIHSKMRMNRYQEEIQRDENVMIRRGDFILELQHRVSTYDPFGLTVDDVRTFDFCLRAVCLGGCSVCRMACAAFVVFLVPSTSLDSL